MDDRDIPEEDESSVEQPSEQSHDQDEVQQRHSERQRTVPYYRYGIDEYVDTWLHFWMKNPQSIEEALNIGLSNK